MWAGFRSEDMSYVELILPSAVAEEFVDSIGREGFIEFTDLNEGLQPYQRQFTKEIMKIQEIQRRIKEIENQLTEYKVPFDKTVCSEELQSTQRKVTIDTIARDVNERFEELKTQGNAEKNLKKQLLERDNSVRVLEQIDRFLAWRTDAEARLQKKTQSTQRSSNETELLQPSSQEVRRGDDVEFKYIAGVVTVAQRVSFERQVFLTSRGNSLVQFGEALDDRMVFAVFFLGNQLQKALRRLCQFMNIYVCYESDSETSREMLLKQVIGQKTETQETYKATRKLLFRQMRDAAERVQGWKVTLLQEKGIRMTLNKFRFKARNNVALAEGWCATVHKAKIRDIMEAIVKGKGVTNPVLTDCPFKGTPPTYFEQTDFTAAFQAIVDTYGVPRYKEFNPAIPTIITFPFLFGVMYGDIFHGSCLLLFAIFLVNAKRLLSESAFKSDMISSLYFARYVLLFMGMFSLYCGVIYNDCMSIMINGWNGGQWQHGLTNDGLTVVVQRNVYAVGVDPSWSGVDNQLTFANSLKMKLSVIIGVTQMTFGLFLKLSNHLQERDYLSVFFEFVPQLVFMVCFFGYMVFLIFYKWCIDWSTSTLPNTPSLITVLINMFLSPGSIDQDVQIFGDKNLQGLIQTIFLLALVVSIPAMLCIKPCILRRRMSHAHHMRANSEHEPAVSLLSESETSQKPFVPQYPKGELSLQESKDPEHSLQSELEHQIDHDEHESFGDIVIHQLIHTIEYVLGTISNTASYLRLWALSLAHAELSEVFLDKTLRMTLGSTGVTAVLMNVAGVFAFLLFTSGVLLIMDVLECFLHALRLHWVEFQNKFYYADGRAFQPFCFSNLLSLDKV